MFLFNNLFRSVWTLVTVLLKTRAGYTVLRLNLLDRTKVNSSFFALVQ